MSESGNSFTSTKKGMNLNLQNSDMFLFRCWSDAVCKWCDCSSFMTPGIIIFEWISILFREIKLEQFANN